VLVTPSAGVLTPIAAPAGRPHATHGQRARGTRGSPRSREALPLRRSSECPAAGRRRTARSRTGRQNQDQGRADFANHDRAPTAMAPAIADPAAAGRPEAVAAEHRGNRRERRRGQERSHDDGNHCHEQTGARIRAHLAQSWNRRPPVRRIALDRHVLAAVQGSTISSCREKASHQAERRNRSFLRCPPAPRRHWPSASGFRGPRFDIAQRALSTVEGRKIVAARTLAALDDAAREPVIGS
jgi:hypothetical protein